MKPNQMSKITGKPCCPEQTQAEMSGGEPNAQELALVTKSFVHCLVERGYGSKDLIEAALMLLDGAIEELHGAPADDESKTIKPKAQQSPKGKPLQGQGASEKLVAAPR
ncbi:MAG: hypothetical protein RRB13_01720 [bacterium]|nr:hypothetical protein [bacterium]